MSDEKYVVVTTTYPSTYGCHRGMKWSRADMIRRSDVELSDQMYNTFDEAADAALEKRNDNCSFECYDECVDDADELPFRSAAMGNYDNDEEVTIQVMLKKDIDEQIHSDQEHLQKAGTKLHLNALIKSHLFGIRIKDAGGVHYSYPPKPYDIPAELDIDEKEMGECTTVDVPENSSSIKSLMYAFSTRLQEPHKDHSLFKLLRACESLEELYIRSDDVNDNLSVEFFEMMQKEAPHIVKSLRVLSLARIHVDPEAIERISLFQNLERLDLTDCFSVDHYNDFADENEPLPYDNVMISCIEALPKLKRLDIGNKDQENQRYMHDYSLSRDCLYALSSLMEDEKDHIGIITRDESNEPDKFKTTERADAARADALLTIWKQDDLPIGVRNLAQTMHKNDAAKHRSKRKR